MLGIHSDEDSFQVLGMIWTAFSVVNMTFYLCGKRFRQTQLVVIQSAYIGLLYIL